ncbi:MAG: hypothetical protein KJZ69_11180 [Phycisphaerales bacterium]|nr:hypothetical protein [Phycisphaerales bacterium]
MSIIGIEIQNTPLKGTIDVETMRNRLTSMRDRLQQEIDSTGGNPQMLDRLAKIDSQIERLDRLDGRNLSVSAERMQREIANGMKYLGEGLDYLQRQGEGNTAEAGKLQRWFDHLDSVYRHIDTHG